MSDQLAGVYLLCDPKEGTPRYVGQTINLARRREDYERIHEGRSNRATLQLCNWIWDLKKSGSRFVFFVAYSEPFDVTRTVATSWRLDDLERKLIHELRGTALNMCRGGRHRWGSGPPNFL